MTGVNVEREFVELQIFQECLDIADGRQTHADIADFFGFASALRIEGRAVELDVVNRRALCDLVTEKFVVVFRHRFIARLRNAPRLIDVAVDARPAQEIIHAREGILRQNVFGRRAEIHRLERDALVRLGVHLLLERRALEKIDASLFPLLVSGRREFRQIHVGEIGLRLGVANDRLKIEFRRIFLCIAHTLTSSVFFELEAHYRLLFSIDDIKTIYCGRQVENKKIAADLSIKRRLSI